MHHKPINLHHSPLLATALLLAFAATCHAGADYYSQFTLGVGYDHISLGDSDSQLHSMDALRFEPYIGFSPFDRFAQFRIGVAVGISMVLDNTSRTIISNDGSLFISSTSEIPFLLIEPELRFSWRQDFKSGFFIEPGVGVGGAIGELILEPNPSSPTPTPTSTNSIEKWDANFAARAFITVGMAVPGGEAGIQASYMRSLPLHFAQNVQGNVTEYYIGFYGALRF